MNKPVSANVPPTSTSKNNPHPPSILMLRCAPDSALITVAHCLHPLAQMLRDQSTAEAA
ncbi:MAG: hypothetical protein A4E49_03197 [Methanosaeta sp. PtaU1.Bin112]|nr:MAG: hypothetical protein A4E49_03197 [Methanosaeta sp. PtaU1.Bin112]